MEIGVADLVDDDVRALISDHQRQMSESSPAGTSFALDLAGLDRPEVTVFAARDGGELLAVGALMALDAGTGEVKSMRTTKSAIGRGIGQVMLDHIEGAARERGYHALFLETGTGETFAPANRLYARNGFERRGPFGGYRASEFNIFYEKRL